MVQYTEDLINYSRFRDLPGAVYTRSGVAYQQNASGVWVPFEENVPPISAGVGLGVWEAATNLLLQSGRMDNASWSKISGATVALVSGAPDGTSTFAKVTAAGGNTSSRIQQSAAVSAASVYMASVYIAADTAASSRLAVFDGAVGTQIAAVVVNWAGGVPSLGTINGTFAVAPALTQLGTTGIWHLTGGVNSGAFTSLAMLLYPDYTAGLNSTKFWGAEFKLGSYVTPYVATTSAAATRGAPSAYLNAPGVLVPPFTVQVWAQLSAIDGVGRVLASISDGTNANRLQLERSSGNFAILQFDGGTGTGPSPFSGKTGARLLKMALRVRDTSLSLCCDGAGPNTATGITLPPNLSVVRLGASPVNAIQVNGDITRFQIINRDVTDAELQALTQ